jgi:cobalt-zinc-cadmium efflux system membrane fusion protein
VIHVAVMLTTRCMLLAFLLFGGCADKPSDNSNGSGHKSAKPQAGIVRLTAEEIQSGEIVAQPVVRQDFKMHRDFPATVASNHHATAHITALVRGRVLDVYADFGQQVRTGEVLARVYSGELGMAQSSYLKAGARLYVTERASERAEILLREKVIGLAELQRRKGEMLSARAARREAQDRLRLLGMTDDQIARLDRDQIIRSNVPITAPFDGRVILRNLTKGEVVEVTHRMFTIANLSEVWVLANIPEKDIPFILNAERTDGRRIVEVRLNAYPEKVFRGTVTYVGDVLDVATRTMNLRVELPNPDHLLKPEMYATVRVYSRPANDALIVPENAVQRDRDRRFVFVQRDPRTFEARDVKLGDSNGKQVAIIDGLREGEQVVANGGFILKSELMGEEL